MKGEREKNKCGRIIRQQKGKKKMEAKWVNRYENKGNTNLPLDYILEYRGDEKRIIFREYEKEGRYGGFPHTSPERLNILILCMQI
jgi:hypothetical protein